MKFFNLVCILSVSLFLVSCDTKRNPYFGDDDAQFVISTVESKSPPINSQFNSDGLVSAKQISFTACLKNLAGEALPSRLQFEVQAGNEKQLINTNPEGCIVWKEEHSFDPLADHKNFRLHRVIVSRNDFTGKRNFIIYWNPQADTVQHNINNDIEPQETEDPPSQGFKIQDINQGKDLATEGTNPGPVAPTINPNSSAEQPNQVTPARPNSSVRLVVSNVSLEHITLNQEKPYSIDKNLTLFAQHTYKVNAVPKFYVKTLKNLNEEQTPTGGKYKITLVFMEDLGIDLEQLSTELNNHESFDSLMKSTSAASRPYKLAAELLISNKEIQTGPVLDWNQKKRIMTKALVGRVHATTQYISEHKPGKNIEAYINLRLKKLEALNVRSVVAMTIENVSNGQKQSLKGHGIGYIKKILEPGDTNLIPTVIEADLIYNEYSMLNVKNEKLRPLDMFLQTSALQLKDRAMTQMDTANLKYEEFPQAFFEPNYPFALELEEFFANTQTVYRKKAFLRSLCNKIFLNEDLRFLEKAKQQHPDEQRLLWTFKCHSAMNQFYDISIVDFIESAQDAKVLKLGESVKEEIKISRDFVKSDTSATRRGGSASTSLDMQLSLVNNLIDGVIVATSLVDPILATGIKFLKNAFPMSSGSNWYMTTSTEVSETKSGSISKSSSQVLKVNIDSYRISPESRRCAIVTYKQGTVKYFADHYKKKLKKGFIVCSKKTIRPTYVEKYYMVTQDCSEDNGTTDCASASENRLRMMLRGETTYKMFNNFVLDSKLEIMLDLTHSDALDQQRMQWTTMLDSILTSQIFPGAIVPSIQ